MKRNLSSLILITLTTFLATLTTISAYGGQPGTFIGGFYLDLNMIGAAIIFVLLFWMMSFATSKLHMFGSKTARIIISLILSLFSIYGLVKTGLSFEKLFQNIGLDSIIEIYFPHIIIATLIICVLIFGLEVALMLFGTIFILLGLVASNTPDLIYNWGVPIAIGAALLGIGIFLRKKYPHKHIGRIRKHR